MNSEAIIKGLLQIGLSEREASVYVAAIGLGPTSVLRLSRATGIKRSTLYSVVESLESQGLMSVQTKGFKRLYAAESPEGLEHVLERRQQALREILPDLNAAFMVLDPKSWRIREYRGLTGIKSIYTQLLKELRPNEFYYVISDQHKWYELDPEFFESFKRKRANLQLDLRLLLQDSASARANKKVQHTYNEQIKLLPDGAWLNTNMIIVPHKVVVLQTIRPAFALAIENPSIVQLNRMMFELLWERIT